MNEFKNNNSLFIVGSGIILAAGRLILGNLENTQLNVHEDYILVIMAIVNYVAMGFVILFLYNDIFAKFEENLKKAGLDTSFKKKCRRTAHIISAVLLLVYVVTALLYIYYFKTSDLNDAISIFALALSIASVGITEKYAVKYYKMIVQITKKSSKKK